MKHTDQRAARAKRPAKATHTPAMIENSVDAQDTRDLLRFITCGNVDDGKSTLIGRMLWEGQHLYDDQLAALKRDSARYGTQGNELDLALLVDGLGAEREQHITIDVAYRFFSTSKRKFIVADAPGHEQYTRNMVGGASTANVAVLLVDARTGLTTQTRRHAYVVALMGIRQLVLAINKMDLVRYDREVFQRIEQDFAAFSQKLPSVSTIAIPLSALKGDNVQTRTSSMPWYSGPTLMGYLETVDATPPTNNQLVFPVQYVNRPNDAFRGFAGTIEQGELQIGDTLRVGRSGQIAQVKTIDRLTEEVERVCAGDAVTLTLDREIDVGRGDVLSLAQTPLETTDHFEANLIWTGDEDGLIGRSYEIKLATQWTSATITTIKYGIDLNTLGHEARRKLSPNDICVCNIATSRPLVYTPFSETPTLGRFIVVDRDTHATVAVGIIRHNLRRAQNVHAQSLTVNRARREHLNGHAGKVIWFTGLSGSGKSTIANALEVELHARGYRTYLLDGDNLRQGLNKDLGFTDPDRVENIRRVIEVARLMQDAGLIVITALISPFRRERAMAREKLGDDNFVEVYVNTSLEVCEQRDTKGLYKRARAGLLPNFSGISSAYEIPRNPDFTVDGSAGAPQELASNLLEHIEKTLGRYQDQLSFR
ncbi:adenylyl-sulfate kinase [Paraburkholderia sp. A3RO-2L]|uniref:adenylyl-sulfate kinase n=1 Tax=Paraburkholderia sp. A3RO-2L TaxID=3028376 RepID=UPI003DA8435A